MQKPIKNMTKEEKDERIAHLSHRFYDVNCTPSVLLYNEMRNTKPDETMLKMLQNLETLEVQRYHIEEECSAKLTDELRPLKRIFEYEVTQLMKQQEKERIVPPFDPFRHDNRAETEKRHKQEVEKLKKDHHKHIEQIRTAIMNKLKIHDNKIQSAFMDAVRYLYR